MYASRPAFILYIFLLLAVIVALNLLFTGNGQYFNIGLFLTSTSPYMWGLLGTALSVGLSVVGAAWYLQLTQGNLHHRRKSHWSGSPHS
jgi:V-type H+-transporting ATPase 21kDa proteolipid subunit